MTDSIETTEDEALPWVPPVDADDVHAITYKLPPLPKNLPNVVRRIRACEGDVAAQVVFEHALNKYAIAAIEAQGVPDKTGTAYADLHAKWRKGRQELANLTRAHERLKAQGVPDGWQPIETAPKDVTFLLYGSKRLEMCVGMNHSRDGWVTDTTSEWASMYPPTHWMPLPTAPGASAPPAPPADKYVPCPHCGKNTASDNPSQWCSCPKQASVVQQEPLSDSHALKIFNDLEKFLDQIEDEEIADEHLAGKSLRFILDRVAAIKAAHGIQGSAA